MVIGTARLQLIPIAAEHLRTLVEEPGRFQERAGFPASDELRAFYLSDEVSPEWLEALRAASGPDPWRFGFAVVEPEGGMIGAVSFKGPPDPEGAVEIAYGIVPSRQGRGYATEAAAALVAFAFDDPRVVMVRAHTLPGNGPSQRVLVRCGFAMAGEVDDPDDGRVLRWERPRTGA